MNYCVLGGFPPPIDGDEKTDSMVLSTEENIEKLS